MLGFLCLDTEQQPKSDVMGAAPSEFISAPPPFCSLSFSLASLLALVFSFLFPGKLYSHACVEGGLDRRAQQVTPSYDQPGLGHTLLHPFRVAGNHATARVFVTFSRSTSWSVFSCTDAFTLMCRLSSSLGLSSSGSALHSSFQAEDIPHRGPCPTQSAFFS